MNTNQGQTKRVLEWMQTRGPITTLQATYELGITRLAARIDDMENGRGVPVTRTVGEWVKVVDRNGRTCRVKAYRLAPKVTFDKQTGQGYLALP